MNHFTRAMLVYEIAVGINFEFMAASHNIAVEIASWYQDACKETAVVVALKAAFSGLLNFV